MAQFGLGLRKIGEGKEKESEGCISSGRSSNWRVERVKIKRRLYFVSQFGFETLVLS